MTKSKFTTYLLAASSLMILTAMSPSYAQEDNVIRICTGGEGGGYWNAGEQIAKEMSRSYVVEVMSTGGTTDNMDRLIDVDAASEEACDVMIGQPDGPVYLKRTNPAKAAKMEDLLPLHKEYAHFICSKASGIDDIEDLENDPKGNRYSIDVGAKGSGAWLMWQNFVNEDPDYGEVTVKDEGGKRALTSVSNDNTTCAIIVAAIGYPDVVFADATMSDTLVLASATDWDFNNAEDLKGNPLYEFEEFPSNAYPNFLGGWFAGDVETVTMRAMTYVNPERVKDNRKYDALVEAVAKAGAKIRSGE